MYSYYIMFETLYKHYVYIIILINLFLIYTVSIIILINVFFIYNINCFIIILIYELLNKIILSMRFFRFKPYNYMEEIGFCHKFQNTDCLGSLAG